MDKKTSNPGHTLRLVSAYQQMSDKGKAALDRMVGHLAKIHGAHSELFINTDVDQKRTDKRGYREKQLAVNIPLK